MEKVALTEVQKQLIERLGVNSEKEGIPPAPARVMALLMVSPELDLSFNQIQDTLGLSKSATSNAINLLLNTDRIDYITHPGDRKRYFKNKIGTWKESMQNGFQKITNSADLLEEILAHRPKETAEFNKNLKDIISFMRYINKQLPELYRNWEKQNE